MQDIFLYDAASDSLRLNTHEILLVPEFAKLWDPARNICTEDPSGELRLRAWREFTYIWFMCDWKSLYQQYIEEDRHAESLRTAGMTKEEYDDPTMRAAIRKYIEIKESSRILTLIQTAHRTLEKLRIFLDSVNFNDLDANGKPIFKAKDVMADIAAIATMREKLNDLETAYKRDVTSVETKNRGDAEAGFDDE